MKGYFASKPLDLEEVRGAIGERERSGRKPAELHPIAAVTLSAARFHFFSRALLEDWPFLVPYAEKTIFKRDGTADCVLVKAEGKPTLAVCMEGYDYARYVALVLDEEPDKG